MGSAFERSTNGFRAAGSIVAIKSKSSKGGAVQILIECPLDPKLAQAAYEFFERSGTIEFDAVEEQLDLPGMEDSDEEVDEDRL